MGILSRWSRRNRRTTYPQIMAAQRSAAQAPLRPWQVSGARFRTTRFGRRGLNPDEVYAFLARVAGDLAAAYLDLERKQGRAAGSGSRRRI